MGALQIPVGTYHRSTSGPEGSVVLNQSVRDPAFDYSTEFIPVRLADDEELVRARSSAPWIWTWKEGHICRHLQRDGDRCDAVIGGASFVGP